MSMLWWPGLAPLIGNIFGSYDHASQIGTPIGSPPASSRLWQAGQPGGRIV
jgi:hypothetical protein